MESVEYLGKKYAIYCNHTKKIVKVAGETFGGLTQEMRDVIIEMFNDGQLYSVINKRNGYYIDRFVEKDDAIAVAKMIDGYMAVKEELGKTVFIGESKPNIKSAIQIDKDGNMIVVRGSVCRQFQKRIDETGTTGNMYCKRALGSFTKDEVERNYVKGYMWNSVKSRIINKPISKPKIKRENIADSIYKASVYNGINDAGRLGKLVKSVACNGMSKNQRKRLNKRLRERLFINS